ncbi:MAG: class I SAM-dependent methyltransferase [Alphaproteobacteria bacterium]|nr:class I SAM-dependent methyltransferase [Alphaproteobacteria bacterium]MBT4086842.1 class I SAM-dependent methyltransferase [Alphaproteobacteria bacterium]MBT4546585.1 class I SAM-dependent methyltransferase [Alphaproteobacteria bacterium]MBT7745993.1 class I SAM-dependent methyltransferase [Alphaproteobacteria bacterium]
MTTSNLSLQENARIDFALYLRRRWSDVLYPALNTQYELEADQSGTSSLEATENIVTNLPVYPWFAWMERGAQKMLWRSVSDVVEAHPEEAIDGGDDTEELELNPSLKLPAWYTDWDIHVQPGGVWRNGASARVYELGAKLVMLGENDRYGFHDSFLETAVPKRTYARIVDLGCGFGKSTWPLKKTFPQAEVIGIELAAPCLQLAHRKAKEQQLHIRFIQADACETGLEDQSCDLVTATMLIHEIPEDKLQIIFTEAARILMPGGLLRILDFQNTGQPVRDVVMAQHGARNNEPFMPPMMNADLNSMCDKAGLVKSQWVAFDERGTGRLENLSWPDRAEWHFPWAVLEAEKAL